MEQLSQFNGPDVKEWKGYTIEDLRYERALNNARREIVSEQIKTLCKEVADGAPITSGNRTIFSKITASLSYIDYGIMAVTAFSRIRKMFSRAKSLLN